MELDRGLKLEARLASDHEDDDGGTIKMPMPTEVAIACTSTAIILQNQPDRERRVRGQEFDQGVS